MSLEEAGFLKSIQSDPEDSQLRLIFADWLDDHQQPERAELIRLQCQLAELRPYDANRLPLQDQINQLTTAYEKRWRGRLPRDVDLTFQRGLMSTRIKRFNLSSRSLIGWWHRYQPWIEEVELTNLKSAKLQRLIKEKFLDHVSTLNLSNYANSPTAFDSIKDLTGLHTLKMGIAWRISSEQLSHVESLQQLQSLELYRHNGMNHGLERMPELPLLKRLQMQLHQAEGQSLNVLKLMPELRDLTLGVHPQRSSREYQTLGQLPNLEHLYLYYGTDPGTGVAHLAKAKKLRHFRISHILLSEATVRSVAKLKQIEGLRLCPTDRVGKGWMKHLRPLKKIRYLDLSQSKYIQQGDFSHLSELKDLEELNLNNSNVDARGLRLLSKVKSMKRLFLRSAQISPDDLKILASFPNLESLSLGSIRITDAGLKHLASVPTLRWIDLTCAQVTKRGIVALRRALGNVHIER